MRSFLNSYRWIGALALIAGGVLLGWKIWPRSTTVTASRVKPETAVASDPLFQEVTNSGASFRHWCGDSGKYLMPEAMGSGIALIDYDRDGDLDIFVVQGMPPSATQRTPFAGYEPSPTSRLYQQISPGKFEDATVAAGLEDYEPYGMGVAVGDINNDGWPDLYVSKYGSDRLFLNQAGKFVDVTAAAGIDNPRWGTSACFTDYDRDGWLDLWVVNYVDYYPSQRFTPAHGMEDYSGPNLFDPVPAKLFRNVTGDRADRQPRFRDVSFDTGIDAKPGPGLGVLPMDFNDDGWIDLYAANDAKANFLWVNRQGQNFVDEAIPAGVAYDAAGAPQASMGVTAGDVDGDGRDDLFMTHIEGEYSTLYLQVAPGNFEDRTNQVGVAIPTVPTTGFGTALLDLDLDGDLDLVIGNGKVRRRAADPPAADQVHFWQPYAEPNQIFLNGGTGLLALVKSAEDDFISRPRVTRGLAVGDIDNDGDLDLVTSEVNGPARIFLNIAERQGSWLMVRALDPRYGNRDAYGAMVTVTAGKQRWSRMINPAYSYLSSNDPRVHFGLGRVAKFEQIEVRWPDGAKEVFPGGVADNLLTLRRGEGAQP